jgi:hypothetical protein
LGFDGWLVISRDGGTSHHLNHEDCNVLPSILLLCVTKKEIKLHFVVTQETEME